MTALDRLLARPARRGLFTVPLDANAAEAVGAARAAVYLAEGDDDVDAAVAVLEAAEAALVTVTFHLHAIGAERVEELMAEHPATKAQRRAAVRAGTPVPSIDSAPFLAALVAEATDRIEFSDGDIVDSIDVDQAAAILATLSVEDRGGLQGACLRLDREATVLGAG